MKNLIFIFCLAIVASLSSCGSGDKTPYALIQTDLGDIKIKLYKSVPGHTANFIKQAESGYYDGLLFHRVMDGFMIQGGDPNSRGAAPGVPLGGGGPGYTIPAEIKNYHFRGALSAARTPDRGNPERASSGSQFFIVDGSPVNDALLDRMEMTQGIKYTEAERNLYKQIGGYPSLDNQYTAYGEVVEGMDVVDKIAAVPAAPQSGGSRPFDDIPMKKVSIIYE